MEAAELRGSPLIAVVKTADFWELDHPALLRRLNGTGLRGIFVESQMCPGSMIVAQEAADNASEVSFPEYDYVIQTLPWIGEA